MEYVITATFAAVAIAILKDEIVSHIPGLCEFLIRAAAAQLSNSVLRSSLEEEWLAHLHDVKGPISKFAHAGGCVIAAPGIALRQNPLSSLAVVFVVLVALAPTMFRVGLRTRSLIALKTCGHINILVAALVSARLRVTQERSGSRTSRVHIQEETRRFTSALGDALKRHVSPEDLMQLFDEMISK